jgi:hypothetical protein
MGQQNPTRTPKTVGFAQKQNPAKIPIFFDFAIKKGFLDAHLCTRGTRALI